MSPCRDTCTDTTFNNSNRITPDIGFLLASLNTGASRALWPGLLDAAEQHDVNLISFPGGRLRASTPLKTSAT